MPFEDLFGNRRIKKILSQYLSNNIAPDSLIFSGPVSTSKRAFALAYAKAINCLEEKNDFCDHCRHCDQINRGLFPDVIVLAPEGRFYKKEQISFLINENSKRPMTGDKKIFLLKDSHMMNENAANAFLKILEEPALSSTFILLTHNLNGLLSTIKSRCQILKFTPPSQKEIYNFLVKSGTDERKARLVSHLSICTNDPFILKNLNMFLEKRSHALSVLVKLITKKDIEDVLLDLYGRSRNREKFLEYFNELIYLISLLLRDIMILKINNQSEYIINIDLKDTLMNLAEYMTIQKVLFLIYRMELLYRDIQRNLNIRVLILEFIRYYTQKEGIDV
jgi:DNA polymerase-3 subunit delta'